MKNFIKIIFITFLFINSIEIIQINNSFGQNTILLHKKYNRRTYLINKGKRIKIITINNEKLIGEITEIKDSSIVIKNERIIEVSVKDIRFIYFKNNTIWKYVLETGLLSFTTGATWVNVQLITLSTDLGPSDSSALIFVGCEGAILTSLFFATKYLLFYKRKYDVQNKYEILIIKQK